MVAPLLLAAPLEVDLVEVIMSDRISPESLSDGVFNLHPPAGRRLFVIPHRVPERLDSTLSVDRPDIKLSGGVFVAWMIPEPPDTEAHSRLAAPGQLDPAPPRFARGFELRPDGTVHWELPRVLLNASPGDPKRLYALKAHRELSPAPPRIRDVDRRAPNAGELRRQAVEEFKAAQANYKALTELVREAPESFSGPAPSTVYAVYYTPENLPRLGFSGDDPLPWNMVYRDYEAMRHEARARNDPRNWYDFLDSVTGDDHPYGLRMAAAFLAANGNIGRLDANSRLLPLVEKLGTQGDAQTRRMLVEAVAVSEAPVPVAAPFLDAAMRDTDPFLAVAAMRARVNDVARRGEPLTSDQAASFTETAGRILADENAPPLWQVLAHVKAMAALHADNFQHISQSVRVHTVAAPRRAEAVAAVLALARRGEPLAAIWLDRDLLSTADTDLAAMTLDQITATPLQGAARADAQGGYRANPTARFAPPQPTPGLPSMPEPEPRERRSGIGGVFDLVESFGQRSEPSPTPGATAAPSPSPAPQAPASTSGAEPGPSVLDRLKSVAGRVFGGAGSSAGSAVPLAAQGIPAATEAETPYPLDTPEHNLLKLLKSSDNALRDKSWTALEKFAIATPPGPTTSLTQAKLLETYAALGDAAAAVRPTPMAAVAFVKAQSDPNGVNAAMRRILAAGDGPARIAAIQHVAAGGAQALAPVLAGMSPDEREDVARLWYRVGAPAAGEPPPLLEVGLLRHGEPGGTGQRLIEWFAGQVAQGARPSAGQWAQAVGSDGPLLAGLMDPDEKYALGCAAAMIGTIMPPDAFLAQQLRQSAEKIAQQNSDPIEAQREIAVRWDELKKSMIRDRLQRASGAYEVVLSLVPMAEGGAAPGQPVIRQLGKVMLSVDANNQIMLDPKMTTATQEHPLTLTLTKPQELAVLPGAQALQVQQRGELPNVTVVLVPDAYGRWSGAAVLPDRRQAVIVLIPAP